MTTFLRGPALWITERPLVRRLMTEHRLGRQLAGRFVAGDSLESGMAVAKSLNGQGIAAMLDHLGENVASSSQASEATDKYVRALKRVQESPDIECNMSVKLTQLGMDVSTELCAENMERVLQTAAVPDRPILVMIDMESSEYVDRTLDVYLGLRDRYSNLGVCLQAYLYRTAEDAGRIAGPGAVVRMVKGAYLEPPGVAYRRRQDVRANFAGLAATLLARGSVVHLATHDTRLVEGAREFIRERGISPAKFEFQMLYGIRRDLQSRLVGEREPVRVYIPYGNQWYPYLTRRLAERPANAWFFLSNLFRRGG